MLANEYTRNIQTDVKKKLHNVIIIDMTKDKMKLNNIEVELKPNVWKMRHILILKLIRIKMYFSSLDISSCQTVFCDFCKSKG